jgi:hypothetical protein
VGCFGPVASLLSWQEQRIVEGMGCASGKAGKVKLGTFQGTLSGRHGVD